MSQLNSKRIIDWYNSSLIAKAASGDMAFDVDPATVTSDPVSAAWTRSVVVRLVDSDNNIHKWFNKAITTGVSIANTSSAGTATIPSTTLTFVNGKATVVVSGDAADWLGGTKQQESITCSAAVTDPGDIELEVTSALLTGAEAVAVPIAADDDSVTKVAEKCVIALNDNANVSAHFVASNVAGKVIITAKVGAANDATLAFAFTDTDTTSVAFGSTTNETAGVAKETDTLTVAQASINGYTIASATSVETFSGD